MIVLDTHAWLWWVDDPSRLSRAARRAISGAADLGVSAVSAWEVALLARRGRIRLDRAYEDWVHLGLSTGGAKEISLDSGIALRAAGLSSDRTLRDPADALIAATALEHRAPLVTRDRRMDAVPDLRVIW